MTPERIKLVVEGALFAAREPVNVERLVGLFAKGELPPNGERQAVREALDAIAAEAEGRAYELVRVASGHRLQVRRELGPWVSRLFDERAPRYSRALLETLALIAYRQPTTRGDIEQVRGVAVSPSIMRTLLDRGWIRAVGQRETPGRPTMYGTTRRFLDYFNLRSLDEMPPLAEIKALVEPELDAEANADAGAGETTETGEERDEQSEQAPRAMAEVVQLPIAAPRAESAEQSE